jgi:branched-chain amino acid transport system ATP-binding protein
MTEPLLTVEKLEVVYHRVATAVHDVSFAVPRGKVVAVLGSNGAGKTTTLRAISGFIGLDNAHVTRGAITFAGRRIENLDPRAVAAMGVVLVPEREKVFENLTVAENLEAAVMRRSGARSRGARTEMVYSYLPALARLKGREAGYLSGGERQALGLGSALMCEPDLLLVDEMSLGLAPIIVADLIERLRRICQEQGLTALLVEQNAAVALDVADYIYVMENGRIVFSGEPDALLKHQDIREFYLGQGGSERRSYRDVKQYRKRARWYG